MLRHFSLLISFFFVLPIVAQDSSESSPSPQEFFLTDLAKAKQSASENSKLLLVLFFKENSPLCERVAASLKEGLAAIDKLVPLKFGETDDVQTRFKWLLNAAPSVLIVEPKSETVLARLEDVERMETAVEWVKDVLASEEKMNALKERLKAKDDDAEAIYGLGEIEQLRGLSDDAQTRFERVIKVDEENKQGFAVKAAAKLLFIYLEKKKQQDVTSTAEKIKKWDKENKSGFVDDADFAVAKSFQFLNRMPDVAARRWEEFLKNHPQSEFYPEALLNLGLVEFGRGEREKAKVHWQKAIELSAKESMVAKKARAFLKNMDIPLPSSAVGKEGSPEQKPQDLPKETSPDEPKEESKREIEKER
ncbi:MAG: hypothetical protein N2234_07470 [Planctomycetota bacterium]|nr:hypothetical protein [Planctomycetota bacterium]